MPDKFEFASPEWFEETFTLFRDAAAANPEANFSLCEVFTHVPERLSPGPDGRVAWTCTIAAGRAEPRMGEVPAESVTLKTIGEWEAILPAARAHIEVSSADDMATLLARRAERAAADPRVQHFGDRSTVPLAFVAVHNELAKRTL